MISLFFVYPNLQAKWKFNEILGDYFASESNWVYLLDYQSWFHVKSFEEKGVWAYQHSTTKHFRGFMYFSKETKNYSFFVPSYIITDSSSLIELGTWIYREGSKSWFWNKQSKEWSNEPFILVWNQYHFSSKGGWVNNTNGRFAWDDTYALESLAFLNRIKPSIEISKLGDSVVERFLDGLNSQQNFSVDGITNQFIEGWSSARYTDGSFHTWNVHTAFILHAIGEFYLSKTSVSTNEIGQLEEIFAYIEENWVKLQVGGYFNEPYLKKQNIEIPFNMASLAGCASLTLYNLTKKEKYIYYAKQIFLHLQNNIEIINDCALWPYKPLQSGEGESLKVSDDISHGALGEINTAMPDYVVSKVADALNDQGKSVNGSKILVLGLAYKANVDDCRESPSFVLIESLLGKGADVSYHDPYVPVIPETREHPDLACKRSVEISDDFDLILLSTDHSEYRNFDFSTFSSPLVDARNCIQLKPEKYYQA